MPFEEAEAVQQQNSHVAKPETTNSLYTASSIRFALIASIAYLVLSYFLIGFKADQIILVAMFNSLYFFNSKTRGFITAFSIFIIYWIVFDYMKAFPNYKYNSVHIESIYLWEKSWFGIQSTNQALTPNEYFTSHSTNFLDVLCGLFYLCWIPVPLAFAIALFFRNRRLFFQFAFTFFLVNIIGWFGYYGYPAAPPWYVAEHGFTFIQNTPGNTAGLAKFDQFFNVKIFESIYAKSSNVFAAMPSLHAAYMLIVFYFALKSKMGVWTVIFGLIVLGIWFSAVYTSHHYVLDVVAGITCAIIGIGLFQWIASSKRYKALSEKMVAATS